MKRFDTPTIRKALLVYVVAVTLTGLYSVAGPYLNSYIGRFFQNDAVGQTSRWYSRTNLAQNSQVRAESLSDTFVCNLPDGWQIDRKGGIFRLTHYNPNGSVADCLPFDSLENFYQWFETHPDCCDVYIDKLTPDEQESTKKTLEQAN
jgi:hypothetical protein